MEDPALNTGTRLSRQGERGLKNGGTIGANRRKKAPKNSRNKSSAKERGLCSTEEIEREDILIQDGVSVNLPAQFVDRHHADPRHAWEDEDCESFVDDVQKMDEWLKQRSDSLSSIEFENEIKPNEDEYDGFMPLPTSRHNPVGHELFPSTGASESAKEISWGNSVTKSKNKTGTKQNKNDTCKSLKKQSKILTNGSRKSVLINSKDKKGMPGDPLEFWQPDKDNMLMTPQELERMPESGVEFEESVGPRDPVIDSKKLDLDSTDSSSNLQTEDEPNVALDAQEITDKIDEENGNSGYSEENAHVIASHPSNNGMTIISISTDKSTNTTSIVINTPHGQKTYKVNTTNLVHAATALQPYIADLTLQKVSPIATPVIVEATSEAKETSLEAVDDDDAVNAIELDIYNEELCDMDEDEPGLVSFNKDRQSWKCPDPTCRKVYTKHCKLKVHMMVHSGMRPYRCEVDKCDWAFTTEYKLRRHLETHIGKKDYKCDVSGCDRCFTTIYNLNTHKKLHMQPNLIECPVEACERRFPNRRKMELHMRDHSEIEAPYKCPESTCGKTYYTANSIASHLRVHQKSDLRCTFEGCNKIYDKASRLKQHMWQHTGEKPYVCDFAGCGWAFVSASKLKRHVRKHTGERRYSCPEEGCGKSFMRLEHLQGHLVVHSGSKPFECPHENCKARFTAKSSLYVHMKKHNGTNEKTIYSCQFENCNKKYNCKSSLRLHIMRYHTPLLADAGQLDYITLLSNENLQEMVTLESSGQKVFTTTLSVPNISVPYDAVDNISLGNGECTFTSSSDHVTQDDQSIVMAPTIISDLLTRSVNHPVNGVAQFVVGGDLPTTDGQSGIDSHSGDANMEAFTNKPDSKSSSTSRVSQENYSGSARTDYCSNHRLKKHKKIWQNPKLSLNILRGETLPKTTSKHEQPLSENSNSISVTDDDVLVQCIQSQLLQEDSSANEILYHDDGLLSSVSVGQSGLGSELVVPVTLLSEPQTCGENSIGDPTTSHEAEFNSPTVATGTEFTSTTINLQDLE